MGTIFTIIAFVIISVLVVGGLMFVSGKIDDSRGFAGKALIVFLLGIIITIVIVITNGTIQSIPGWIVH